MIDINDYTYDLPVERIALHPPQKRDQSKLLVYNKGRIQHQKFSQIVDFLDVNSLLVMNDTRVIPARLRFTKSSGAAIEIFLLSPLEPSPLVQQAMLAQGSAVWKCAVGNIRRWNPGTTLQLDAGSTTITAELIDREGGIVKFTWAGSSSFAEVIESAGETPLPPYLKRDVEKTDRERYQTVYAAHEGAVAAPTAGLHLTDELLLQVKQKGIQQARVTLHVGAGTFMPVKSNNALEHTMHEEQIIVTGELIEQLLGERTIVAVGTTSLRVLESIYWYGCKLAADRNAVFHISQTDAYGPVRPVPIEESLTNVLKKVSQNGALSGSTAIYIHPGFQFHLCDALITNFHQPGSTLMLLVAAFIGPDWKKVYGEALENGYRFLSYGDSSLLVPTPPSPSASVDNG